MQRSNSGPPPAAPSCTLPGSSWQISTLASSASFRGPAQPRLITSIISPGQLKVLRLITSIVLRLVVCELRLGRRNVA
ncbi:unnamed protein product [Arctogadus glacialis]